MTDADKVKMLREALENIVDYARYETEYDGSMYLICHDCGAQDHDDHREGCAFVKAKEVLAATAQPEPEPVAVIKESLNTEPVAQIEGYLIAGGYMRFRVLRPSNQLSEGIFNVYTTPPANKDSERLAFVLEHGTPGSWNYPSGKKYGYARGNQVFESAIEAIDSAMAEGER